MHLLCITMLFYFLMRQVYFARRARRRAARNHYVACDYNLTGNTTGFCPECGAAIAHDVTVVHV